MAVKKKALGWELITDLETYGKVTEKRLREQLERLERQEIKFLVLAAFPYDWRNCFFAGIL